VTQSALTIRSLRATAVEVPMKHVLGTSAAALPRSIAARSRSDSAVSSGAGSVPSSGNAAYGQSVPNTICSSGAIARVAAIAGKLCDSPVS